MNNIYFFGCWGSPGHHLYTDYGKTLYYPNKDIPFAPEQLDNSILLPKPEMVGYASRYVIQGWTIVSWWNRTYDSRPGTNAAILIKGDYSFDEAWDLFKQHFSPLSEYTKPILCVSSDLTSKE